MEVGALILDGDTKSALAAIRALGEKGIKVAAAAERSTAMGLHSRYSLKSFQYPSPVKNPAQFSNALIEFGKTLSTKPLLYCFSDATYLSSSRQRQKLEQYFTLCLPEEEAVETAFSKMNTYALARRVGVPTIKELELAAVESFPVVLKPQHSVSWQGKTPYGGTAEIVFDHTSLKTRFEKLSELTGETPIIQEFIEGVECGVELLCEEGEVVQEFAHERVRSLSPRGGAATVKRTLLESPERSLMSKCAWQMAGALKWTGPLMVEFKIEAKSNKPVLMELNGRFWGSLPLPQLAGFDFVSGFYALGRRGQAAVPTLPAMAAPAQPMQTQHFLGDCQWLLQVLFAHDPLRSRLYPSRLGAIEAWLQSTVFDKSDVWRSRDPKPSLMEYIDVVARRR